jgi:enamine deaminase RidA (YjgF/YER057c/UK114 family)
MAKAKKGKTRKPRPKPSAPPRPVGAYVPVMRTGHLLFVSGQLPFKDGRLMFTGHVGSDVTLEQAREAAVQAARNAIAHVVSAAGGAMRVRQVVRVTGYVASAPGFTDQPKVMDTASQHIWQTFGGTRGQHARVAVGVAELPMGAPVELEMIVEVSE